MIYDLYTNVEILHFCLVILIKEKLKISEKGSDKARVFYN